MVMRMKIFRSIVWKYTIYIIHNHGCPLHPHLKLLIAESSLVVKVAFLKIASAINLLHEIRVQQAYPKRLLHDIVIGVVIELFSFVVALKLKRSSH